MDSCWFKKQLSGLSSAIWKVVILLETGLQDCVLRLGVASQVGMQIIFEKGSRHWELGCVDRRNVFSCRTSLPRKAKAKERKGRLVNQGSRYIQRKRKMCFRKAKVKAMLEPPWARQSSAVPINTGRSKRIMSRAAQLMDPCRVNPTRPSWGSPAACLHTACGTCGQCSWCSFSADVIQHSCEMAFCSGYPDTQHLEKRIQPVLRAAGALLL